MEFAAASIWQDFKTASRTEHGTIDDNANEVILGPRLNEAVRHLANGYLKQLELGPEHKATDERAKLLDLHWGRIEHDGALLQGLGAAMTTFAETLGANVTTLAEAWQGESYDAFKAAIDKVQRTMSEYGAAATSTGDGLVNAMGQVRELYQTFADDSADKHLNFGEVSPPEKWHKISDHDKYSGFELAEACSMWHLGGLCQKDNDEQRNIITDHWVTERRWEICKQDPCESDAGRVNIMYRTMVDECQKAVDGIKGKLDAYFGAVNTTVDGVSKLYDAALGNVYNLANEEVFSSLRVIGGQPTGGGAPVDGGPDSGSYPAGGGDPGPAAVAEPPQPEPEAPVETVPVDAAAQETPVTEPAADQRESVEIKDGDRTIGVTSPDGAGRVLVTVADAAGNTKSYELDFDAASGLPSASSAAASGAEQIPARTNGKCVIQDGPLTITAERPLFSPDSIKLVVDDGSGKPATYTLDFEEQQSAAVPTPTNLTSPQSARPGDQAVSGVLVPDRSGEAGLAKAPDAAEPELAGMAGAGLPITVSPATSGPEGRAGSGWSVHGDLFDNAEPVYSMHGVLGDDDGVTK